MVVFRVSALISNSADFLKDIDKLMALKANIASALEFDLYNLMKLFQFDASYCPLKPALDGARILSFTSTSKMLSSIDAEPQLFVYYLRLY